MIRAWLLKNKIENEFKNRNKNICFIFDILEKLFKDCNVKKPEIIGGFVRDILFTGSWHKIESLFEKNIRDIDIVLDKSDFYNFICFLNKCWIRFNIINKTDSQIRMTIDISEIGSYITVDILVGDREINSFDSASAIGIDIYKRKFINIKEINNFIFKKQFKLSKFKNKLMQNSLLLAHCIYMSDKYQIPISSSVIKDLKSIDDIMYFEDYNFLSRIFIAFEKRYLKHNGLIEKYFTMCDIYNLDKFKDIMVEILSYYNNTKYKKEIKKLCNEKIKYTFNIKKPIDIDFVNLCHNADYTNSIFFYFTLRSNGCRTNLEIGKHDGHDWVKESYDIDFLKNHDIDFCIDKSNIIICSDDIKYFSKTPIFNDIYVLNYDAKNEQEKNNF